MKPGAAITIALPALGFESVFRQNARSAVLEKVRPENLVWCCEDQRSADLFGQTGTPLLETRVADKANTISVPKAYLELMKAVLCHSDPERFALLYDALWRLQTRRGLLQDRSCALVSRLEGMAKTVRRDCHKMTAFVRFRELDSIVSGGAGPARRAFHAWFEPDHWIVERTAPFFANRFGDMDWIIETPKGCARFHAGDLSFSSGVARPRLTEDDTGELWNTYYLNIFNPARLKVKAMQSEMPKKYWRNMPETALIPEMIANAQSRAAKMQQEAATIPPVRAERMRAMVQQREEAERADIEAQIEKGGLNALRQKASVCTRCPLHCNATQTVFGEGPSDAGLMLVGEQPGDQEDLAGRPFVGPAGQLLNQVMQEAGIERKKTYLTNAVKHFKFTPRGKRRLHKNPERAEVFHCKWWLNAERQLIRPKVIVALGGTAALALTGSGQAILKRRGHIEHQADETPIVITLHPSAILRLSGTASSTARSDLLADLRLASQLISKGDGVGSAGQRQTGERPHTEALTSGSKLDPVKNATPV